MSVVCIITILMINSSFPLIRMIIEFMSCFRGIRTGVSPHFPNSFPMENSNSGDIQWYRPHPYGVYPRGNAKRIEDISNRLGTLSKLVLIRDFIKHSDDDDGDEHNEHAFIEVVENILSFLEVPDLCQLSAVCTGWYVLVHCTNAFKNAFTNLSPRYMKFTKSWKESAIRIFLESQGRKTVGEERVEAAKGVVGKHAKGGGSGHFHCPTDTSSVDSNARKRRREAAEESDAGDPLPCVHPHQPILVSRPFFSDYLFQSWLCTILPLDYHLHRAPSSEASGTSMQSKEDINTRDQRTGNLLRNHAVHPTLETLPVYTSRFKTVDRRQNLTPEEFVELYESTRTPVILMDVVQHWPIFQILDRNFSNLSVKKTELTLPERSHAPLRCEFTNMNLDDYVRYAKEQVDERPIYMFDSDFSQVLDAKNMYSVPEHFARDDYFRLLGDTIRPKYRWIIAGPARGGSSFHVDPNYTHAWNANLTGRKRWLFFPPSCPPPGVVPSCDMSEVATPLSLTEWLLNNYDASVSQLQHVGYECICEPGDLIFVPCGWWHSVVNLQDSVAITQNYISRTNITDVLKFLRAMKTSISGINEDSEAESPEEIQNRRNKLGEQLESSLRMNYPELMKEIEEKIESERKQREKKRFSAVKLLENNTEGFTFDF